MDDQTLQKKQIKRRIYAIWLFRKVFNTFTVKLAALALLFSELVSHVSVKQVIANWNLDSGVFGSYTFLQSALLNTEFITQAILLGMSALIVLFARDWVKKSAHTPRNSFVRI